MFRTITFFLVGLFSLTLIGITSADEAIILDEILVRGANQAPYTSNLTIREVRESAARDIGEALQTVPGMTIVRKGAIANDVVLRGLQKDNINVMLDGIRLYGGCPSRMDPPSFHFDFAEVETIEIIRGPYDLSHPGSLGGMVNAISKKPGDGPNFNLSATGGSYDMFHASATASYGAENYDLLGGYAYKYSRSPESGDGKRLTEVYPDTSPNRYRDDRINSRAYDIKTGWLKSGYKFGETGRSELSYSYQDADHVLYPYLFMDADYDKTDRVSWTTRTEDKTGPLETVELQLWWDKVEHLMSDRNRASSLPSMMVTRDYGMETDSETSVYGARGNGTIKLAVGEFKTGIDYYQRNWDATNTSAMFMMYQPQAMLPDVDIDNTGGFAEYTFEPTPNWEMTAGLRVDYTEATANKIDATRLATFYQPYHSSTLETETDFTEPGGNIQLTWKPQVGVEMFAGIASSSRPPDPQELYIGLQRGAMMTSWVGNPALDPVRNNQADLGLKMTTESLFTSISFFYSDLNDYIYLTEVLDPDGAGPLGRARTYSNIEAELWGGELSAQAALPQNLFLNLTLNYTRGENDDLNEPLAETPPLNGSISLRYDVNKWFFEATERFADRQDRVAQSLQEEETAGWNVTDIKGGYHFNNWSVIAGVNNLFDNYYFTHLSYQRDPYSSGVRVPEPGMTAYLTVSCAY